jgi:hypothetical protein
MKAEMIDLLKRFREHNKGIKPESIVIYRDGVSHGEFKEVRNLRSAVDGVAMNGTNTVRVKI